MSSPVNCRFRGRGNAKSVAGRLSCWMLDGTLTSIGDEELGISSSESMLAMDMEGALLGLLDDEALGGSKPG